MGGGIFFFCAVGWGGLVLRRVGTLGGAGVSLGVVRGGGGRSGGCWRFIGGGQLSGVGWWGGVSRRAGGGGRVGGVVGGVSGFFWGRGFLWFGGWVVLWGGFFRGRNAAFFSPSPSNLFRTMGSYYHFNVFFPANVQPSFSNARGMVSLPPAHKGTSFFPFRGTAASLNTHASAIPSLLFFFFFSGQVSLPLDSPFFFFYWRRFILPFLCA